MMVDKESVCLLTAAGKLRENGDAVEIWAQDDDEVDAVTNHPNVLYLYPNALYAEIEVNYIDETITLIRGHNYPEPEITNGFDWEFDNTHPYEFDSMCQNMDIYKIKNGWMTTCYPENVFFQNTQQLFDLLKIIKDL